MKNVVLLAFAITVLIGSVPLASKPAQAQQNPDKYTQAYRERINKINERFRRKQIEAGCKAEAKKAYGAIHFKKRRAFMKDCIERNSG